MTDIYIGGRGSGKTTRMIEECSKNKGSVIVCPSLHDADYVAHMAEELGIDIPKPISFAMFCNIRNHRIGAYTGYFFDRLDAALQMTAGFAKIHSATFEETPVTFLEDISLKNLKGEQQ